MMKKNARGGHKEDENRNELRQQNFCSAADTTSLFVFQDNLPLLQFHSLSNNDTQSVLLRFKMYPLPRHMRTNMDMC